MPSKLVRFEKLINLVSKWLSWISLAGLLAMMLIIFTDVTGTKLFQKSIIGADEYVSILGFLIVAFGLAYTQTVRGHIEIEFLTEKLSKKSQAMLEAIVSVIGMVLFVVIAWQMLDYGLTLQASHRTTSAAGLSIHPFIYASIICFIMVCPLLLIRALRAIYSYSMQTEKES